MQLCRGAQVRQFVALFDDCRSRSLDRQGGPVAISHGGIEFHGFSWSAQNIYLPALARFVDASFAEIG